MEINQVRVRECTYGLSSSSHTVHLHHYKDAKVAHKSEQPPHAFASQQGPAGSDAGRVARAPVLSARLETTISEKTTPL